MLISSLKLVESVGTELTFGSGLKWLQEELHFFSCNFCSTKQVLHTQYVSSFPDFTLISVIWLSSHTNVVLKSIIQPRASWSMKLRLHLFERGGVDSMWPITDTDKSKGSTVALFYKEIQTIIKSNIKNLKNEQVKLNQALLLPVLWLC